MPFCESLHDWTRSQDFFGHQVSLNFDRNGDTHNTVIGGTFSVFIRCFIAWYVSLNCYQLLTYDNDTLMYTESLIDLNKTDAISYNSTDFYFFGVLKNLNYKKKAKNVPGDEAVNPIFLEENLDRYIQVLFIQSHDNWYEADPNDWFTREQYSPKHCSAEDLGPDGEYYMKEWAGFSLLCPDISKKDYKLQNTLGNSYTKYLTFEIRRCVNSTENNNWCHPDEKIDAYLSTGSIELWTIQTKVDFNKYSEAPLYGFLQLQDKKMLDQNYLQIINILADTVIVESINSWFYVSGDPTYSNEYLNADKFVDRSEQWTAATNTTLVRINIYRSALQKSHERQVYGFIDLLGDLGGILEVIMVVTGGLIMPISEHHYILQAAKRIFMARTSDPTLFQHIRKGNCNLENNSKMIKYTDYKTIQQYATVTAGGNG